MIHPGRDYVYFREFSDIFRPKIVGNLPKKAQKVRYLPGNIPRKCDDMGYLATFGRKGSPPKVGEKMK